MDLSQNHYQNHFKNFRSLTDTLIPGSFIDSSLGGTGCASVVYSVDVNSPIDSGYVAGTNIYKDLEKGQRFYLSDYGYQGVTINKIIAHFGIIQPSGASGFVFAKIYNLNQNGFPDSLLGISDTISISDLVIAVNGIAEFNFISSVTISSSLLVSVDFSNCLLDTLALVHTEENCFDTTGGAWEKWADSTWHSFNNSWQFETDLALFPMLSNGVLQFESNISLDNSIKIFPNPACKLINVYSENPLEDISVYDFLGRKFKSENINSINNYQMDFSSFSNGTYFLKLSGKEFVDFEKIVILK